MVKTELSLGFLVSLFVFFLLALMIVNLYHHVTNTFPYVSLYMF